MPRVKELNGNYAEYIERLLNAVVRNEFVSFKHIDQQMTLDCSKITQEEKNEMLSWAYNIQNTYHFKTSEYIGRNTKSEKGDLILNNQITEFKCVSQGSGTYFNTSVTYLDKFGILNPIAAYERIGYRDTLERLISPLGYHTTEYGNLSFVTQSTSTMIQKKSVYNDIKQIDGSLRAIYTDKLSKYFKANPEQAKIFIFDMLYKCSKGPAEQMLIYNYHNNTIHLLQVSNMINENLKNNILTPSGKYGFSWGDGCRVQLGWQNGSGLNNYTLRVFI